MFLLPQAAGRWCVSRGGDTRKGGGNMIQCQYVEPYRQSSRHILSGDQQWWGWISHVARWTTAVSVRVHVSVCAGTEEVEATIDGYDSSPAGGPTDSSTGGHCAVHRVDSSRWHERYVLRCNEERMLRGHSSGLGALWCGQLVCQYILLDAPLCVSP